MTMNQQGAICFMDEAHGIRRTLGAIQSFNATAQELAQAATRAHAKAACELSRDAWLSFYPRRKVLLRENRELVRAFEQSLEIATNSLVVELHDRDSADPELQHYLENMEMRLRLLRSVLSGGKDFQQHVEHERALASSRLR